MVAGIAEQHVADVEPLGPLGIIDPGDLHQRLILQHSAVAQRNHCLNQPGAIDGQIDLADQIGRLDQHVAERRLRRRDHAVIGGIFRSWRFHAPTSVRAELVEAHRTTFDITGPGPPFDRLRANG